MNGARMRWYSDDGTHPAATSDSVPRLIAPWRAQTRTVPEAKGPSVSPRISAWPGPTYHSAWAVTAIASLSSRFDPVPHPVSYHAAHAIVDRGARPFSPYCVRSVGRSLDRRVVDPGRAGAVDGWLRCRCPGASVPD